MIAQLEEKGYLTRARSQQDNRVVNVTLTKQGRKIADNTPLGGLPLLRRQLGQLSEERLVEIDGVLTELSNLIQKPQE
jgi:DNA-binding MarR family transcriptional regulator